MEPLVLSVFQNVIDHPHRDRTLKSSNLFARLSLVGADLQDRVDGNELYLNSYVILNSKIFTRLSLVGNDLQDQVHRSWAMVITYY